MHGLRDRRALAALGAPEELGFTPQPMTRWLGPRGLAVTAAQVGLAAVFGAYADKREIQAALKQPSVVDYADRDELWLDWLADTGDGFNPTYATASLLARAHLELAVGSGHGMVDTRRGELLVLGGDIVYPVPSPAALQDRFVGPFAAALPAAGDGQPPPTMLACAGNHDWYDGLTGFLRLFCNQRRIGAWRTRQTRSYFAVRLPHDWWLFAIDLAFDYFIDEPQLDFFTRTAEQAGPGAKVILATHRPSWLAGGAMEEPAEMTQRSMTNLQRFEHDVIHARGLRLELVLAGDIHHYNRYASADGARQRITCGAGGAFLHPTHTLAAAFHWPEADGATRYTLRSRYPDARTSKRLRWGTLLAPLRNPSFVVFIGFLYLVFALAVRFALDQGTDIPLQDALEQARPTDVGQALFASPVSFLMVVALAAALVAFADAATLWQRAVLGLAHWLAHLFLMTATVWTVAQLLPLHVQLLRVNEGFLQFRLTAFGIIFVAVVGLVGGFLGAELFALYLFLVHTLLGRHRTQAFSCQRIEDWRSLLRLKVERDGTLTIFPIGMRRVPRRWRRAADRAPYEPLFEPADRPLAYQLIEPPIRLRPAPAATRPRAREPGDRGSP